MVDVSQSFGAHALLTLADAAERSVYGGLVQNEVAEVRRSVAGASSYTNSSLQSLQAAVEADAVAASEYVIAQEEKYYETRLLKHFAGERGKSVSAMRDAIAADTALAKEWQGYINYWSNFTRTEEARDGNAAAIQGSRDAVFRYADLEVASLDPHFQSDINSIVLSAQMFEGLMVPPRAGESMRFGAAYAYDMSPTADRFIFHIRPDLTWSDGTPLTAHDFEYSWKRVLTKSNGAEKAGDLLPWIENAKAFYDNNLGEGERLGVRALNDHTLEVKLAVPEAQFPKFVVGMTGYYPVPQHVIEAHGEQWTRPENIVCSGAYCLTKNKHNEELTFARQESYHAASQAQVASVRYFVTNSQKSENDWFKLDKIDWATHPTIEFVRESDDDELRLPKQLYVYRYIFNHQSDKFSDVRARKAVSMLIDRASLVRHVMQFNARSATSFVARDFGESMGYPRMRSGASFDPARGREILEELGYTEDKPLRFEVVYNTSEQHRAIAEMVQQQVKRGSGGLAVVDILNVEWGTLSERLKKPHAIHTSPQDSFEVGRMGFGPDYPSLLIYLEGYQTGHHYNYAGYNNEAYDGCIASARVMVDTEKQVRQIARCEQMLLDDVVEAVLFHYDYPQLLKTRISGFDPNFYGINLWRDIRVAE